MVENAMKKSKAFFESVFLSEIRPFHNGGHDVLFESFGI